MTEATLDLTYVLCTLLRQWLRLDRELTMCYNKTNKKKRKVLIS